MALRHFLYLFLALGVSVTAEIEMEFTKQPESVTAPVGDKVTFVCAVKVPGERLAWRWKPVDRPDAEWRDIHGISDKDQVSTKLMVEIGDKTPSAFYQCVVWYGSISLASVPARLTIARLDLSRNTPEKRVITAPLHNFIVLHCKEPFSEPPAVMSWWKETGHDTRRSIDTPHGVLVIKNATKEDSGTYGCTATNELSGQIVDLPERTYLKVQHEGAGGVRFLESEDYVGTVSKNNVLMMPVRPNEPLRLWCGVVGTPPPRVSWSVEGEGNLPKRHEQMLLIDMFTSDDEGVYTCSAGGHRRSWKVVSLQPAHWEGSMANVNTSEGGSAKVSCGEAFGQPTPKVHWLLNAEPIKGKGVRESMSDLTIEPTEKRHAGIVQCFACNELGCDYDAALLTVVPMQISDQEYSAEQSKAHFTMQPPKRHNRKSPKKHKAVMIPPSRPNVTRMTDESVMVSWSWANAKNGLPIQFFKVQYKEATNSSNVQWYTVTKEIPPHIQAYEIHSLIPDKSYKFRIAAVYSNQDNKQGRSTGRFHLQRGGYQRPDIPVLNKIDALSPYSIELNWTWSNAGSTSAEGFYVYYRAVSSAGEYTIVAVPGGHSARSLVLSYLNPDTAYEIKMQSYTVQSPSDFSSILSTKTHRLANAPTTTTEVPPEDPKETRSPNALVTAGGALGGGALLVLAVTVLLCRRAKRPPSNKEKGSVPESGTNGYIPAKVPITITANPMHSESGDGSVEMSFLHNNNCGNPGNNDDTLPHSRKNGPATRQYV